MIALKKKKHPVAWRIRREMQWYSFILPTIVCLILFTYIPLINSLRYSLYRVSVVGFGEEFIGLRNYQALLGSSAFWNAVLNTVILAVFSLISIPVGFVLATQINSLGKTRAQSFFRVSFYLPNMVTGVSVVLLFQFIFLRDGGLINSFLSIITGREITIGWLTDPSLTKIAATILGLWSGLGYNMLINLAGMQPIPQELYEAASIDGCNGLKRWLFITIPNMTGTFTFLLITSVIGSFSRFTDLFLLSGNSSAGNPSASLQTILMYIYQFSFRTPNFGLSTAGSMVLFVLILTVTLFNLKVTGFFKKDTL